ncbi:MAG: choice-of-anchor D domain-containing protein [Bacteroidales bacterium]|nr:choice-of-anchor D domain-containing protein [Clostridiales bacterium]MCF8309254.1 choice-of-anchor D domain-containing protein [Bacteroidales bacterium]
MNDFYQFKQKFLLLVGCCFCLSTLVAQNSPADYVKEEEKNPNHIEQTHQNKIPSGENQAVRFDNRDWTIVESYAIEQEASGLAYDGEYLYFGKYLTENDHIYRFDPSTGDYEFDFTAPIDGAKGLTYDGSYLWSILEGEGFSEPSDAIQFDFEGNQLDEFELPDHYMSGIAYDEGDFWSSTYADPDGHIYKTDDEGNILDDFSAPDNQPWGLTVQGEYLWMADKWGDALYKIDKATGDLLETHSSESTDPSGITWDGQYLWYLDAGESNDNYVLYKVDLGGSGAPQINIPNTSHDYGLVNVGDSETWDMTVQNTGEVDLTIEDMEFNNDNVSTSADFPIIISPDGETTIPVTYSPQDFSELDTTAIVYSDDPINSEMEVQLNGHGVYEGPTINIPDASHDYGAVRVNATKGWYVDITNQGDETLTIEETDFDNPQFYLHPSTELPLDIPVLGKDSLLVWFYPQEATDYEATLTVTSNDVSSPNVFVDLMGSGNETSYVIGDEIWSYQFDFLDWGYNTEAFAYLPDLNEDGQHEIVAAFDVSGYILCLNGNADGNAGIIWKREIPSGGVYYQQNLTRTSDLNGDDFPDLVVGTTGGDRSIRVLSGKTGENIWQYDTHEYGNGGWVRGVFAKYDYNNDDTPDVLAATGDDDLGTGPKRIFCLDGTSGTVIWDYFIGGFGSSVIGVPDFNDDGQEDVVAGASMENATQGKVIGIDGATGSEAWSFETGGTTVWALEHLSDINDDQVTDVIAGDFGGNYYMVDPVDGSIIEDGTIGDYIIRRFDGVGDVNDDGYQDIVPAHSSSNMMVIDGQTGDYVWSVSLADQCSNVMAMEDVNGDLVKDFAVGTLFQDNYMYIVDGSNGEELMSEAFSSPIDAVGVLPDVLGDDSWEAIAGGREGKVTCYSGGLGLTTHIPSMVETNNFTSGAAPNPFSRSTTISFVLDHPRDVTIDILDMKGVKITTLASRHFDGGIHKVRWNADVAPGVYFYRIHTGSNVHTGKVVVE